MSIIESAVVYGNGSVSVIESAVVVAVGAVALWAFSHACNEALSLASRMLINSGW